MLNLFTAALVIGVPIIPQQQSSLLTAYQDLVSGGTGSGVGSGSGVGAGEGSGVGSGVGILWPPAETDTPTDAPTVGIVNVPAELPVAAPTAAPTAAGDCIADDVDRYEVNSDEHRHCCNAECAERRSSSDPLAHKYPSVAMCRASCASDCIADGVDVHMLPGDHRPCCHEQCEEPRRPDDPLLSTYPTHFMCRAHCAAPPPSCIGDGADRYAEDPHEKRPCCHSQCEEARLAGDPHARFFPTRVMCRSECNSTSAAPPAAPADAPTDVTADAGSSAGGHWVGYARNCFEGAGAEEAGDGSSTAMTVEECEDRCRDTAGCQAIVVAPASGSNTCWTRRNVDVAACEPGLSDYKTYVYMSHGGLKTAHPSHGGADTGSSAGPGSGEATPSGRTHSWLHYPGGVSPADGPAAPTEAPTHAPTKAPTDAPTHAPTEAPTKAPTHAPTEAPTHAPTEAPTDAPTETPTDAPTSLPSVQPSDTCIADDVDRYAENPDEHRHCCNAECAERRSSSDPLAHKYPSVAMCRASCASDCIADGVDVHMLPGDHRPCCHEQCEEPRRPDDPLLSTYPTHFMCRAHCAAPPGAGSGTGSGAGSGAAKHAHPTASAL